MHGEWSAVTISALSVLCGSLVGALGSSFSAWIVQRHQDRRDIVAKQIYHREQLYSAFISETAQAFADAVQHTFHGPERLIPSYALLSRMRLSSSAEVVTGAERVIQMILQTYSKPNLSPEEIQAWAGEQNDPLRDFSNLCRGDLESLWSTL